MESSALRGQMELISLIRNRNHDNEQGYIDVRGLHLQHLESVEHLLQISMISRRQPIFVSRIPNSFLSDTYIHKFSFYRETGQCKFKAPACCMATMSKSGDVAAKSDSGYSHIVFRGLEHHRVLIPELPVNA